MLESAMLFGGTTRILPYHQINHAVSFRFFSNLFSISKCQINDVVSNSDS